MTTREEALQFALSFTDAYQDAPFHDDNWQLVRYRPNKKVFLETFERNGYMNLNVKVDPGNAQYQREMFTSIIPGYHTNKEHWNTIILDGSVPDDFIRMLIEDSYNLIS